MAKIIGIIGGVGPAAGLDLHRKILRESRQATRDQEHLEVLLHTNPRVPDRTGFLLGREAVSPCRELIRSARLLAAAGAELLAVACMTAHGERIFGPLCDCVHRTTTAKLVSLVDVSVRALAAEAPAPVGLLATEGTIHDGTLVRALADAGRPVLVPDCQEQRRVSLAIYAIKSGVAAARHSSRNVLTAVAGSLIRRGAAVLLLGCTEIPLVIRERELGGAAVIDPVTELARLLVAEAGSRPHGQLDRPADVPGRVSLGFDSPLNRRKAA